MIRTFSLLTLGATAAFGLSGQPTAMAEETTLAETVGRIAVLPARIDLETDDNYLAAERFNQLVDEYLAESGIDYIPVSEYLSLRHSTATTMGGSFDPFTGQIDAEKANAIQDLTFREFERVQEFDSYLIPNVISTTAVYDGNDAEWDGVQRYSTGEKRNFLNAPSNLYGGLMASSFFPVVIDKTEADTSYYAERAGIELMLLVDPAGVLSTVGLKLVEPEDRLRNDEYNRAAIAAALGPLIKALQAAETNSETEAGEQAPTDTVDTLPSETEIDEDAS